MLTTVLSDVIDVVAMVTGFGTVAETVETTAGGTTGWGILTLLCGEQEENKNIVNVYLTISRRRRGDHKPFYLKGSL